MSEQLKDRALLDQIRLLPLTPLPPLQHVTAAVMMRCGTPSPGGTHSEAELLIIATLAAAFCRRIRQIICACRGGDPMLAIKIKTTPRILHCVESMWSNIFFIQQQLLSSSGGTAQVSLGVLQNEVLCLKDELSISRQLALETTASRDWNEGQIVPLIMEAKQECVCFEPKHLYLSSLLGDLQSEVVHTNSQLSLKDPLTLTRLATPVRSTCCRHLQCFELKSFLQMCGQQIAKKKSQVAAASPAASQKQSSFQGSDDDYLSAYHSAITRQDSTMSGGSFVMESDRASSEFPCPVCNTSIGLSSLYVDSYVQSLLSELAANVVSVTIDPKTGAFTVGDIDDDDSEESGN